MILKIATYFRCRATGKVNVSVHASGISKKTDGAEKFQIA